MIHDLHLETLGWMVDGVIFEDEAEALWEWEAKGPESVSDGQSLETGPGLPIPEDRASERL